MTTRQDPIPCTLAILTKNVGLTLERALACAPDFAETIICDGGSTDATLAIAEAHGARVLLQDPAYLDAKGRISDFAGVRNQTLRAATQPWFFFLDSDEYVSGELVESIRAGIARDVEDAFIVLRRYVFEGVEIECAYSYPNRSMRLFRVAAAAGFVKKIHERIKLKEGTHVATLSGALLVPVDPDLARSRAKGDRYIALQVAQAGSFSWSTLFNATGSTVRASLSYGIRTIRNRLFCRGTQLPLSIDLDAQWYNIRLIRAYWAAKLRRYRQPPSL